MKSEREIAKDLVREITKFGISIGNCVYITNTRIQEFIDKHSDETEEELK